MNPPILKGEAFVAQEIGTTIKAPFIYPFINRGKPYRTGNYKIRNKLWIIFFSLRSHKKIQRSVYFRINKKKNIRCKTIHTS